MDKDFLKVKEIAEKFYKGLGMNSFEGLQDIFTDDVNINIFTTGQGKGFENVDRLIHYYGPKVNKVKQNIENIQQRVSGDKAQMTFHELTMLVKEKPEFAYVQYGGTYALSFIKENESWKISSVKYDFCWCDGNTYWLKDWRMLDYTKPNDHKQLIGMKDSVFYAIPSRENITDERDVYEKMLGYGWVVDTKDFSVLKSNTSKNYAVYDGYHDRTTYGIENVMANALKPVKEPCMHHTFRVTDIAVDGDKAHAKMNRVEPNRLKRLFIDKTNWKKDWFTLDYDVDLVREDGQFKLDFVSLIVNIYPVDADPEHVRFYER